MARAWVEMTPSGALYEIVGEVPPYEIVGEVPLEDGKESS